MRQLEAALMHMFVTVLAVLVVAGCAVYYIMVVRS